MRVSPRERGFTLTELMVVLIIMSILGGLSIKFFRSEPVSSDARRISALMMTASRAAVAGGAVRADVVAQSGISARTQIEFDGNTRMVTVYRLAEHANDAGYDWVPVDSMGLATNVAIQAVGSAAEMKPLAESGHSMPTALSTGKAIKYYYADGTADAMTVFVKDSRATASTSKWRVTSLQLQPAPQSFRDW